MLNIVQVYQNEIRQYEEMIECILGDEMVWDSEQYQVWQDKILELKYKIEEYLLFN